MIGQVRRFNRTVTQRIGALNDAFLARGRPLGQARLLWEIGPDGCDVRRLRARLDLDSGYLSRLLRSLAEDGLITVTRSEADGRVRMAELTRAGRAERAELDRLSDDAAQAILGPLSDRQRDRLVTAMADVERLLTASAIQLAGTDPRLPAAQACLRAYFTELAGRFDDGFDPAQSISADDAELTRRRPAAGRLAARRAGGLRCGQAARHRAGRDQADVGVPVGPRPGAGPPDPGRPGGACSGRRGQRVPAGDQRRAGRGDQPVPVGWLPRGARVQRRAVRAPLVRKDAQPPLS